MKIYLENNAEWKGQGPFLKGHPYEDIGYSFRATVKR